MLCGALYGAAGVFAVLGALYGFTELWQGSAVAYAVSTAALGARCLMRELQR